MGLGASDQLHDFGDDFMHRGKCCTGIRRNDRGKHRLVGRDARRVALSAVGEADRDMERGIHHLA